MKYETARELLKPCLTDYAERVLKHSGRKSYVCPYCGSGTGDKHTGALSLMPDGKRFKCFSCGRIGDVFDLAKQCESITGGAVEVLRHVAELYNVDIDAPETTVSTDASRTAVKSQDAKATAKPPIEEKPAAASTTATALPDPDFMDYYRRCRQNLERCQAAQDYLTGRGITMATARRFWLGFDPRCDPANAPAGRGHYWYAVPRIVIPCSRGFYVSRRVDGAQDATKVYPLGCHVALFNAKIMDAGEPFYVVESATDAMIFEQVGCHAVAINSCVNWRLIVRWVQEGGRNPYPLLIALDNDKDGREKAAELKQALDEMSIPCRLFKHAKEGEVAGSLDILYCGCKDANDAYLKDKSDFTFWAHDFLKIAREVVGEVVDDDEEESTA